MTITRGYVHQGIIKNMNRLFPDAEKLPIPELYYSEEEPKTVVYGNLSEEEIEKRLTGLREKYERLHPEATNDIYPLTGPEARWYLLDRQARPERDWHEPEWLKKLKREVKGILAQRKNSLIIDAKYDSAANRITVYEKAFDRYLSPEKEAAIRRTVAHELFHALHYYLAPATYHEASYEADVVREALADFYSYVLCLDHSAAIFDGIDAGASESTAQNRYRFWENYLFDNIPYPNAIFCMYRGGHLCYDRSFADCMDNGSVARLIDIFDISKADMHRAYIELVPPEFRKNPPLRFRGRMRKETASSRNGRVRGIGWFEEDSFTIDAWEILKKIIKDYGIGSIEELQEFIPSEMFRVVQGRFITLESGEILSAYPQWEIINRNRFIRFVSDLGYHFPYDPDFKTIVEVKLGSNVYTYLYDPDDEQGIEIGETVACTNRNGRTVNGTVLSVSYMSEDEYREYCDRIGYPELSVAKRKE